MTEILLVLATSAAHLVFENAFHRKTEFIAAAAVFWVSYVAFRWRRDRAVLRLWGFRRDTLRPAALACGVLFVAGALPMLAYGAARGRLPFPLHFWIVLWLYPLWGIVQQFLLNGLVVRNLARLLPRPAVVALGGLLFSLAHVPDLPLMGLTAAAGLAWTSIYLRTPNLWALGLSHGFLGAIAYYAVLGRDVWMDVAPPLGAPGP